MGRARPSTVSTLVVLAVAGCGLDVLGTGPEGTRVTGADATAGGEGDRGDSAEDGAALPADAATEGTGVFFPPVDGGADAHSGSPGFCASQVAPFFACWDFDDVAQGGDPGFTGSVSAGGSIDVASEGANHVLRATLPAAAMARSAWVSRAITGVGAFAARYELSFAFGVRQSSLAYVVLGALWATTSSTAHVFGAASHTNGSAIDMTLPDLSAARLSAPSGPAWHNASVTLVPKGATMQATLVVDGVVLEDEKVNVGPPGSTSVDARFGTYFRGADQGEVTVVFDDIVVRTK